MSENNLIQIRSEWKKRIIYIVSDGENQYYIGQTSNEKARESAHKNNFVEHTKNMKYKYFTGIESIYANEYEAYVLELVWIKIIMKKYKKIKILNSKSDIQNANNLFEKHMEKYRERLDFNLIEYCKKK